VSACVFCERLARLEYEWSDGLNAAFEPLRPVTPGHMLIVPLDHYADVLAAGPDLTGSVAASAARLAGERDLTDFNLIINCGRLASQTVFHLHWHLVPRRSKDGLRLPWSAQVPGTITGGV
jgi:histidine triad (HIT) family protein